jgi:phosphatidylglycerophosphatase A
MNQLVRFLSTTCFTGLVPVMPGTVSSFAALLSAVCISFFFPDNSRLILISISIMLMISGYFISDFAEKNIFKSHDPGAVTIDETAGMYISICLYPFYLQTKWVILYVCAFLLFRFFDIVKPLFIKKVQNLPGGYGIMADDIISGCITLIIISAINVLLF